MPTSKPVNLSPNHWTLRDFRERFTTKQWRQILLQGDDTIIFRGSICKLQAINLGAGVVEVSKEAADANRT